MKNIFVPMTHQFTTQRGTFLAFAVSEEATGFQMGTGNLFAYWIGTAPKVSWLPQGRWEIIGTYPGMDEESAAKVVDKRSGNDTAIESLTSLMQAERCYLENPIGNRLVLDIKQKLNQESRYDFFWIIEGSKTKYFDTKIEAYQYRDEKVKLWQSAQERVSAKWIILKLV